jgi:ABC-type dipeptide/oligopeptide/nickel transport system permease subunit
MANPLSSLKATFSEKSSIAPLAVLAVITLFGAAGPALYRVDPSSVFYIYSTTIYSYSNKSYGEILRLKEVFINLSTSYREGFIAYGGDEKRLGEIIIISLAANSEEASQIRFRSPVNVTSISIANDTLVVAGDGKIYISRIAGHGLDGFIHVTDVGLNPAGILLSRGNIFLWDTSGNIYRIHIGSAMNNISIEHLASLSWRPYAGDICGDLLVLVGQGGRIYTENLSSIVSTWYRPVFDDLLAVRCFGDGFIASGRYGSLAIYSGRSIYALNSGTIDDLVDIVVDRDKIYAIGSRGSIVAIEAGSKTIEVFEARGVEGVRRASIVNGNIYLLAYGSFVAGLEPPSPRHPFGTNYYGQDLMAQIMVGIRMSLFIGVAVACLVVLLGSIVGLLSGYFRGKIDSIFNTVINFVYTIPLEPFAILLAMIMRPSTLTVIIAISVLIWRTTARIIRSQTMAVASTQMVEAARALGAGHLRIIFRYILPAVLPLVLLDFASVVAYAILAEATLGFLGVGSQDTYTLGNILNQARLTGSWRIAWWWVAIPGIFIGAISLSIYMFVRSLEPLANPRIRKTAHQI